MWNVVCMWRVAELMLIKSEGRACQGMLGACWTFCRHTSSALILSCTAAILACCKNSARMHPYMLGSNIGVHCCAGAQA